MSLASMAGAVSACCSIVCKEEHWYTGIYGKAGAISALQYRLGEGG